MSKNFVRYNLNSNLIHSGKNQRLILRKILLKNRNPCEKVFKDIGIIEERQTEALLLKDNVKLMKIHYQNKINVEKRNSKAHKINRTIEKYLSLKFKIARSIKQIIYLIFKIFNIVFWKFNSIRIGSFAEASLKYFGILIEILHLIVFEKVLAKIEFDENTFGLPFGYRNSCAAQCVQGEPFRPRIIKVSVLKKF